MLYLAAHCISYLSSYQPSKAVKDMEALLDGDIDLDIDFNMTKAIDVMEKFFWRAETNLIGGMKPQWKVRFNKIGLAWTRWHQVRNPIFCDWSMPNEWFVEWVTENEHTPLR